MTREHKLGMTPQAATLKLGALLSKSNTVKAPSYQL